MGDIAHCMTLSPGTKFEPYTLNRVPDTPDLGSIRMVGEFAGGIVGVGVGVRVGMVVGVGIAVAGQVASAIRVR